MASIINALSSGAGGLVSSGDTSGVLQLQNNSSASVTLDASGNVGIGTTSPTNKLNLTSSSNVEMRATYTSGTNQYIDFGTGSGATHYVYGYGAYPLVFGTNSAERMRIDSSGNVLIGQTTNANGARLAITGNGGGTTDDLTFNSTSSYSDIQSYNSKPLCLNRNGNEVWINGGIDRGAYALQVNTTGVWGAGAYTNGSDSRIKEDIAPINSCLDIVTKLNPVTYKYKEDWSTDQSTQTGFVAQDLLVALEGENYVDGVVKQDSEYMSVAYQNIIPILTKAIQEQQTLIVSQSELINSLTARVTALEAK